MRIDRSGRAGITAGPGARKEPGASGEGFSLEETGGTGRGAATRAAAPVAGLDALLALQAVEDPLARRRRAVRRGVSLLDLLEDMKLGLLAGRLAPAKLEQLAALVSEAGEREDDVRLSALLAEIELRARVELAKFGRLP